MTDKPATAPMPPPATIWCAQTKHGHLHYFRNPLTKADMLAIGGVTQWKVRAEFIEELKT